MLNSNRNINNNNHNRIMAQLEEANYNEYSCVGLNKKFNSKQKQLKSDRDNYYLQEIKEVPDNRLSYKDKKDQVLSNYQQYKVTRGQETQRSRNSASNYIKLHTNQQKQQFLVKGSIDALIAKINQRLNHNEQQIEKLKLKNKNCVKRSQVKQLLVVIKQQKQDNQLLNRENLTDIEKIKVKLQTIQMEIQKNIYSKIDFEKWKLKDHFRKATQENWQRLEEICSSVAQKNQLLRKQIEVNISKIKNWCQNQLTNFSHATKSLTQIVTFRSNKFASKYYSFQYQQTIQKTKNSPKRHIRSQKKQSLEKRINKIHDKQNQSPQPNSGVKQLTYKNSISSKIYFIDFQGYLLDNDLCYLVDSQNKQIKLQNSDVTLLKQIGLLSQEQISS